MCHPSLDQRRSEKLSPLFFPSFQSRSYLTGVRHQSNMKAIFNRHVILLSFWNGWKITEWGSWLSKLTPGVGITKALLDNSSIRDIIGRVPVRSFESRLYLTHRSPQPRCGDTCPICAQCATHHHSVLLILKMGKVNGHCTNYWKEKLKIDTSFTGVCFFRSAWSRR